MPRRGRGPRRARRLRPAGSSRIRIGTLLPHRVAARSLSVAREGVTGLARGGRCADRVSVYGGAVSVAEAISAFRAVQRRFYAGQVGEDALARVLTADVVWHVPGANGLAGDHRGRDAVLRYFTLRRAMADATLRIAVHGEAEVGDLVVSRADGVAVVDGRNAAWRTVGIYRTAGDRVAECWMVPLDQRRFDRVWRSPVDTLLANSVVRHRLVRIVRAPVAAVDSGLRAVTPGDMPVARALFAMRSLPLRLRGRSGLPTADDEPSSMPWSPVGSAGSSIVRAQSLPSDSSGSPGARPAARRSRPGRLTNSPASIGQASSRWSSGSDSRPSATPTPS